MTDRSRAMAEAGLWVIQGSSSMWINRRFAGARIADYHSYAFRPSLLWSVLMFLQAHEHHRKLLESQPTTTYPLEPTGDPAEVQETQRITDEPFGQR